MDSQKSIIFIASTTHELPYSPDLLQDSFRTSPKPFLLETPKSDISVSGFIIGIGAASASKRLTQLGRWIDANKLQALVIQFGFAGGTIDKWKSGTLFIPHYFEDHFQSNPLYLKIAKNTPYFKSQQVDRVVNSVEERAAIYKSSGAVAIDMESRLTSEWALVRRNPLLCFRVLFDTPSHALGPFQDLMDSSGKIRWGQLLRHYAFNPGRLFELRSTSQYCKSVLRQKAEEILTLLHSEGRSG